MSNTLPVSNSDTNIASNTAKVIDNDNDERSAEDMQTSEVPCSSSLAMRYSSTYSLALPRIISLPNLTCQERYDIYCNEMRIADCQPSNVLSVVHVYLEEKLADKKWLALWKGPYESAVMRTVDILVEVDEVFADQAHVNLVEPLVCSEPNIPYDVVEAQLSELNYHLDVSELFPVSVVEEDDDDDTDTDDDDDDEDEEKSSDDRMKLENQQRFIARVVDNVRFYFEHLRRDWDDEDEGEHSFDAYLRARLRLYYDVINGSLPMPLVARYNRTMAKYIVRRKELLDFQSRIQQDGEPSNSEAVECWKRYYEVLMLSGLLQIWETLQLRADGPCFPRVLRRMKGARKDGSTVIHIVSRKLTPSMLRSFADDAVIRQHTTPYSALQQCFEGDQILLFPGVYSGEGFHELTESVTIKGEGKREDVVIEAVPCDDLFINVGAANLTLQNLTFCQIDNTEGVMRVESGHARVVNCAFKCDGTGITVCEGAKLTMKDSHVTGARGSGVELFQGSTGELENNTITCFVDEFPTPRHDNQHRTTKGAVHLHLTDPPSLRMVANKLSGGGSSGITVGRRLAQRYSSLPCSNVKMANNSLNTTGTTNSPAEGVDGGDASQPFGDKAMDDCLKNFVNIEITDNVVEGGGGIGDESSSI